MFQVSIWIAYTLDYGPTPLFVIQILQVDPRVALFTAREAMVTAIRLRLPMNSMQMEMGD